MQKKIMVLVVDDSIDFCEIIKEYFSRQPDMEVMGTANDGNTAIRLITENNPDVVILDMVMPSPDGFEVLKQVNTDSANHNTIFVMMSAMSGGWCNQKALDLGAAFCINKPFDLDVLVNKLRKACTL